MDSRPEPCLITPRVYSEHYLALLSAIPYQNLRFEYAEYMTCNEVMRDD
jgi:hypothetical protein